MKVATYNANSIRSRLGIILPWLKKEAPDILALQETKVRDEDFPAGPVEEAGYHVVFKGEKGYNGVALLSREKPSKAEAGFDDGGPEDGPRLIRADYGKLSVVNTYVPQGRSIDNEMYRYKVRWFGRLREYFERRFKVTDCLIWLGDLNVARRPIDVSNPSEREEHVCYHIDAREALEGCLGWGFVDIFRKYHPEGGKYTFYDYRTPNAVKRGVGWRIDYILATPPLAERSLDSYIDLKPRLLPHPSDHTFLVAEFKG